MLLCKLGSFPTSDDRKRAHVKSVLWQAEAPIKARHHPFGTPSWSRDQAGVRSSGRVSLISMRWWFLRHVSSPSKAMSFNDYPKYRSFHFLFHSPYISQNTIVVSIFFSIIPIVSQYSQQTCSSGWARRSLTAGCGSRIPYLCQRCWPNSIAFSLQFRV